MHSTTEYAIAYNHHDHMFDVFYCGTRIDSMLPSYTDGEHSIQLHQAIEAAQEACCTESPMHRAFRCVYERYPHATIGSWRDYIHNLAPITTQHAIIAIAGYGYSVHTVSNGYLSSWIETVFAHEHSLPHEAAE